MNKYILYVAHGIGDFFTAIPLIESIRLAEPEAIIDIFTCSSVNKIGLHKELLNTYKGISHFYYYSKSEVMHSLGLLLRLGYHNYDYGIVVEHSNSKNNSNWPSRIVQFCAKQTIGADNPYHHPKYTYTIVRDNRCRLYDFHKMILEQLQIPFAKEEDIYCSLSVESKDHIGNTNHTKIPYQRPPRVVFCIGAGHVANEKKNNPYALSLKAWPVQNWIEVGNRLIQEGVEVSFIGGGMEAGMIEPYKANINPKIINYINKLSIYESLQLIQSSDLVAGVDTGFIHAAAILGRKTLTLFGCTDYRIEQPFGRHSHVLVNEIECSPCHGTVSAETCTYNRCMKSISTDKVYETIKNIIK